MKTSWDNLFKLKKLTADDFKTNTQEFYYYDISPIKVKDFIRAVVKEEKEALFVKVTEAVVEVYNDVVKEHGQPNVYLDMFEDELHDKLADLERDSKK